MGNLEDPFSAMRWQRLTLHILQTSLGKLLIGLSVLSQVIELPIKHPELFEALGVAQPKVRLP